MFLYLIQYLSNGFHMYISLILNIDKNVIKVHNYKNVKFFYHDLDNIILISGWYINKFKRHYLIFILVITSSKNHPSFITFFNLYPMIDID